LRQKRGSTFYKKCKLEKEFITVFDIFVNRFHHATETDFK